MMNVKSGRRCLALLACLTALMGVQAASASADEWERFDNCPSANEEEVKKCIYSVVESGEFVLGNKKVPIVNPVVLQGGVGKPGAGFFSQFYGATNGVTLSKSPQPVPGGLLGIVPPENSPWLVKQLSKFFFENGLTGVNSTLELALPASEIKFSEFNLLFGLGTALKLPAKIRLENPFLGKNCYVGSSSAPIWLELTTGTTSPPAPNEPISGSVGTGEILEEGQLAKISGLKLVDNAWAAPKANGCGGILSFLVNPIINSQIGLPSAAGKNTAIQTGTSYTATTKAVNSH